MQSRLSAPQRSTLSAVTYAKQRILPYCQFVGLRTATLPKVGTVAKSTVVVPAALATMPWYSWPMLPVAALGLACTFLWTGAWWHLLKMTQRPRIVCQMNAFNRGVLSRMPTIRSVYKPLMFLTNGHVETIFAALARARTVLHYRREYLLVPDGGVVALDWKEPDPNEVVWCQFLNWICVAISIAALSLPHLVLFFFFACAMALLHGSNGMP